MKIKKNILVFVGFMLIFLAASVSANTGNPDDYLEWDGGDVQWDGGTDTTNGASITTGGWTEQISGTGIYSTDRAYNGTFSIKINPVTTPYYYTDFGDNTYPEGTNYTMAYEIYFPSTSDHKLAVGLTFDAAGTLAANPPLLGSGSYLCGSQYHCGQDGTNCFGTKTTGWHTIKLTVVHRSTNIIVRCDVDDGTYVNQATVAETFWTGSPTDEIRGFKFLGRDLNNNLYVDNLRLWEGNVDDEPTGSVNPNVIKVWNNSYYNHSFNFTDELKGIGLNISNDATEVISNVSTPTFRFKPLLFSSGTLFKMLIYNGSYYNYSSVDSSFTHINCTEGTDSYTCAWDQGISFGKNLFYVTGQSGDVENNLSVFPETNTFNYTYNREPVINTVEINNTAPIYPNENLNCHFNATDEDYLYEVNNVTLKWFKKTNTEWEDSGISQTFTNITSNAVYSTTTGEVDSSETTIAEEWICSVTIVDEYNTVSENSTEITIAESEISINDIYYQTLGGLSGSDRFLLESLDYIRVNITSLFLDNAIVNLSLIKGNGEYLLTNEPMTNTSNLWYYNDDILLDSTGTWSIIINTTSDTGSNSTIETFTVSSRNVTLSDVSWYGWKDDTIIDNDSVDLYSSAYGFNLMEVVIKSSELGSTNWNLLKASLSRINENYLKGGINLKVDENIGSQIKIDEINSEIESYFGDLITGVYTETVQYINIEILSILERANLYMSMDYNTNNGSKTIKSGYGSNGVLNGYTFNQGVLNDDVTINSNYGKYGNGAYFDGDGDYINVSNSQIFNINYPTICAWIYPFEDNMNDGIISKAISTSKKQWWLRLEAGFLKFYVSEDGTSNSCSDVFSPKINKNTWYHVCGVYNGTHIIASVDGDIGTPAICEISINEDDGDVNIGRFYGNTNYFNGSLDNILIYNRSLSASEIRNIYNNQTKYTPIGQDLIFQMAFENYNETHTFDENNLVAGVYEEANRFDGINDYILINSNITQGNSITYSFWTYLQNPNSGFDAVLGKNTYPRIQIGGNDVLVNDMPDDTTSSGIDLSTLTNPISANTWHNIVITYDGNSPYNFSIYVDGVREATTTGTSALDSWNDDAYTIGTYRLAGGNWFNGSIDDVVIFNKSLTVDEIKHLYNNSYYYNTAENKTTALNSISRTITVETTNQFPIWTTNTNLSFDTSYTENSSMNYVLTNNYTNWINNEKNLLQTKQNLNRMYNVTDTSFLQKIDDFHTKVLGNLRVAVNISSDLNSSFAELTNGDIIVFNNGSSAINYNVDISSHSDILNKEVLDLTNEELIEQDTDGIFVADIDAYFANYIVFDNYDYGLLDSNITSVFSEFVDSTNSQNYTDGTSAGSFNVHSASDIRIHLWNPTYVKPEFKTYYGWINSSYENYSQTICDYNLLILDDGTNGTSNINELKELVKQRKNNDCEDSLIAVYISVGDYENTEAWQNIKEGEVDTIYNINETLEIFVDGLDIGLVGATNFSTRFKILSDYIRYDKNMKAIFNTYTAYQNFCGWGDGCMKESCIQRWDGSDAINVDNYSREDWSLEVEKARWYVNNNIRVYCQAFVNRSGNPSPEGYYVKNTSELEDVYLASKVLGYNDFYAAQPDFQYDMQFRHKDLGESLERTFTCNDDETVCWRSYENGVVYYNSTSGRGWVEENLQYNEVILQHYAYDNGNAGLRWAYAINIDATASNVQYTSPVSVADFTGKWLNTTINTSHLNNNGGRISVEAWIYGRGALSMAAYYDVKSGAGRQSWWDVGLDPDTWNLYELNKNWMFNLKVNQSRRSGNQRLDSINQKVDKISSSTAMYDKINISSGAKRFNLTLYSDTFELNGTNFDALYYINSSEQRVALTPLNDTDCITDSPSLNVESVEGKDIGSCYTPIDDQLVFRVSVPHLSNAVFELEYATPPTIVVTHPVNNGFVSHEETYINWTQGTSTLPFNTTIILINETGEYYLANNNITNETTSFFWYTHPWGHGKTYNITLFNCNEVICGSNTTIANVTINSEINITSIYILPSTAYNDDSLMGYITADTNDTHTFGVNFSWYKNGVLLLNDYNNGSFSGLSAVSVSNLSSGNLSIYDNFTFSAQVIDPYDVSDWYNSSVRTITNRVLRDLFVYSPENNTASNEDINITFSVTDEDEGIVCNITINGTVYDYNVSSSEGYSYCYQEFANESTDCGGLSGGSYSVNGEWNDGDWSTFDYVYTSVHYLNYSLPLIYLNTTWKIRDHTGNHTISLSECDTIDEFLPLGINAETNALFESRYIYQCWNSSVSSWITLNTTTWAGAPEFYEEAIIWSITNNTESQNISLVNDGDYYWNISCVSNGDTTPLESDTYLYRFDTTPPTYSNFATDESIIYPEIGNTIHLNVTVADTFGVDSCSLFINDTGVWSKEETDYIGLDSSVVEFSYIIQEYSTANNSNISWMVECNDTLGNIENSSVQSFTVKDVTLPVISLTGGNLENDTIIYNYLENATYTIQFLDYNLFQANVNVTCDVSGEIYYWEILDINTSPYSKSDTINLSGLPLQRCSLYTQASDDHTKEKIEDYNIEKTNKGLKFETEEQNIINILSEDYKEDEFDFVKEKKEFKNQDKIEEKQKGKGTKVSEPQTIEKPTFIGNQKIEKIKNIKTVKETDRYKFDFNFDDASTKRKFKVTSNNKIYWQEHSDYPGHFVIWNENTKTGNWLDFAEEDLDSENFYVEKINDYEYDVYIESDIPIKDYQFESLGGTNIENLTLYFYIGGVLNISTRNLYDNTTFGDNICLEVTSDNYPSYNFSTCEFGNNCTQEFANESTECGGLSGGSYAVGNDMVDGDWSTAVGGTIANANNSIVYLIPSNAFRNQSLIKYKTRSIGCIGIGDPAPDGGNSTFNLSQCPINGNIINITTRHYTDGTSRYYNIFCNENYITQYRISGTSCAGGIQYNGQFYEEQAIWSINGDGVKTGFVNGTYNFNYYDLDNEFINQTKTFIISESLENDTYESSHSILNIRLRNVKTKSYLDDFNLTINNTVSLRGEFWESGNETILTIYLNATTYNLTAMRSSYETHEDAYTLDYLENRTLIIDLGFRANFCFYDERTLEPFDILGVNSTDFLLFCPNGTFQTTLNSTLINSTGCADLEIDCDYIKFKFILNYGATSYYRTFILEPDDLNVSVYLINALTTEYLSNSFLIDDLLDEYDNPRIYITKIIEGNSEQITADYVGMEDKIVAHLIVNQEYNVKVISDNQPEYIVGDYSAASIGDKLIRLYDIGVYPGSATVNYDNNVRVTSYFNESTDTISLGYNDTGNYTSRLEIKIYEGSSSDGTLLYSDNQNIADDGQLALNIVGLNKSDSNIAMTMTAIRKGGEVVNIGNMINTITELALDMIQHLGDTEDERFAWLNTFFLVLLSVLLIYSTISYANYMSLLVVALAALLRIFGLLRITNDPIRDTLLLGFLAFLSLAAFLVEVSKK